MVASNPQSDCMRARLCYYDLVHKETEGNVPESALQHIASCQRCRAEISRLKALLVGMDKTTKSEQSRRNSAITALLSLHLAQIGKPVTCRTVKPFLSSLADPILQIGIPTPITVHLDNCQACSDDLLTLKNLGFTHKQLCRLGKLMAESPAENAAGCSQAQVAIPSVAGMAFSGANAEILKHLCTCPKCRKLVFQHRESIRAGLAQSEVPQKGLLCEEVSATDIFCHCFPYGIDPAADQYTESRESLASHLRSCLTCLGKMQQLHTTIYTIAERPDSEIATCFTLREQSDQGVESESDDMYAGWAIAVQVVNQTELTDTGHTGAPPAAASPRPKQRVSALNLRRYLKLGIAAAAAILIGFALFFSTPAAKAVDLSQVYKALEEVRNVCISRFVPDKTEPIQKVWVSKTLNIKMFRAGEEYVLWDVANRCKKTKLSPSEPVTTTKISAEVLAKVESTISHSFGLVPFSDMSEVPENAQWHPVDDKSVIGTVPGTGVYDLTWSKTIAPAVTEYHKWRGFIGKQTCLPKRTERYRKTNVDAEYELRSTKVITYPGDNEIKSVIRSTFD